LKSGQVADYIGGNDWYARYVNHMQAFLYLYLSAFNRRNNYCRE